jgi:hypothetical protein
MTSVPVAARWTLAPGSRTIVVHGDSTISGPSSRSPGRSSSRKTTRAGVVPASTNVTSRLPPALRLSAAGFSTVPKASSRRRQRTRARQLRSSTSEASSLIAKISRWTPWNAWRSCSTSSGDSNRSHGSGTSRSQTWCG